MNTTLSHSLSPGSKGTVVIAGPEVIKCYKIEFLDRGFLFRNDFDILLTSVKARNAWSVPSAKSEVCNKQINTNPGDNRIVAYETTEAWLRKSQTSQ